MTFKNPRLWINLFRQLGKAGTGDAELMQIAREGDPHAILSHLGRRYTEAEQEIRDFRASHERLERLWNRYGRWEEGLWRRIEEAEDRGDERVVERLLDELDENHETSPLSESEEIEIDWYRDELRTRRNESRMYRGVVRRAREIIELEQAT